MHNLAAALRLSAWLFAAVLMVLAIWTAAPQVVRPSLPYFPTGPAGSEQVSDAHDSSEAAAWLGLIRGDLWVDDAITLAGAMPGGIDSIRAGGGRKIAQAAQSAAESAASLAPDDARAWLLLAALGTRRGETASRVIEPLKMAYYTAPNEVTLMPLRLRIAIQIGAAADDELQNLIGREISTITLRKPELKPVIISAYRNATPEAKRFLEMKVGQLDPSFLKSLQSAGH